MSMIRIVIDLSKNVFAVCGVDGHEKIVLERSLKRKGLLNFLRIFQLVSWRNTRYRESNTGIAR